jgi:hypothetical protein
MVAVQIANAMFMCAKYQMDAYRARGILPHCEILCGEECTNRPGADAYCEHLYLLVQNQSDLVYKSLGIPAVEDPAAVLGAQMASVARRVNKIGVDYVMDRAFEVAQILADMSKTGELNIADEMIDDIARAVCLALFLNNPEDAIDSKMLRVLTALKKMFPRQFNKQPSEDSDVFE